jgi:hypothetical protein
MSNERYLMKRLVDGLSGWLTYQQASHAKTLYGEHFLYPPLHEIAKGRGWKVRAQVSLKRAPNSIGAPKSLDFVLYRREASDHDAGLIFLEVKHLKGKNPSLELRRLRGDMSKLSVVSSRDIDRFPGAANSGQPKKFILVAAQDENYRALLKVKSKENSGVVKMLRSAFREEVPTSVYLTKVDSHLKSALQWHVISFGESVWAE